MIVLIPNYGNQIFCVYKNVFVFKLMHLGFKNWNSSQYWNWQVPLAARSHVSSYSKHILPNCTILAIFPTIVDTFEPQLCVLHFSYVFQIYKKDFFFLIFCWIFLGPVRGHVLVVGSVTWLLKTHKLRAPKTQHSDLDFE